MELTSASHYSTKYALCYLISTDFLSDSVYNHNVVSETTLVCTAVYDANTHSEWLIMINLDQSVYEREKRQNL